MAGNEAEMGYPHTVMKNAPVVFSKHHERVLDPVLEVGFRCPYDDCDEIMVCKITVTLHVGEVNGKGHVLPISDIDTTPMWDHNLFMHGPKL